jgi:hypothetical protein
MKFVDSFPQTIACLIKIGLLIAAREFQYFMRDKALKSNDKVAAEKQPYEF